MDAITPCGIAYKNVGDCPHKQAVLYNRTATHSLYNSTGFCNQSLVSYNDDKSLFFWAVLVNDFDYFNIIKCRIFPFYSGVYLGFSHCGFPSFCNSHEISSYFAVKASVNADVGV